MKIGIIGAGNIGGALGRQWQARGHDIMYGVRGDRTAPGRAGTVAEAAAHGDVVVLAVPWSAADDVVREAGDLAGKVLVDCTNLGGDDTGSGAEKIARWARGAHVVKCFNQAGWESLEQPEYGDHRAVMFAAGDDAGAKQTVMQLGQEIGLDMVDAGPLTNAALLEALAALWIDLAFRRGLGRDFAFSLLRRAPTA